MSYFDEFVRPWTRGTALDFCRNPSVDFDDDAIYAELTEIIAARGIEEFESGYCSLSHACSYRNAKLVQFLLDHGAAINGRRGSVTPLMYAIRGPNGRESDIPDVLSLLLNKGANPLLKERGDSAKTQAQNILRFRNPFPGTITPLHKAIEILEAAEAAFEGSAELYS